MAPEQATMIDKTLPPAEASESPAYRLHQVDRFLGDLRPGDAAADPDGWEARFYSSPSWPCRGRAFHSHEEARQFFISECVLGPGLETLIWSGMSRADVLALAGSLYAQCRALGSPIRESAIRSRLFDLIDGPA